MRLSPGGTAARVQHRRVERLAHYFLKEGRLHLCCSACRQNYIGVTEPTSAGDAYVVPTM